MSGFNEELQNEHIENLERKIEELQDIVYTLESVEHYLPRELICVNRANGGLRLAKIDYNKLANLTCNIVQKYACRYLANNEATYLSSVGKQKHA